MFSRLAAMAKAGPQRRPREESGAANPAAAATQQQTPAPINSASAAAPAPPADVAHVTTDEQQQQQQPQAGNENDNGTLAVQQPNPHLVEQTERSLLVQLPNVVALLDARIDLLQQQQRATATASAAAGGGAASAAPPQLSDNDKDDVVRLWCLARLAAWRHRLLLARRQTDPDDRIAFAKCVEDGRAYELSFDDISPLLEDLRSHSLPVEFTSALFGAFVACHLQHNFLEAENLYFSLLMGSNNWHFGLHTALHVRASHEKISQQNVKSVIHNTTIKRALLVFKELINLAQQRWEQERRLE